MVTVQSMLRFAGKLRPDENQLIPGDRGLYTCLYENEVNSANSSMHLRIEHAPIVLHQYNKVAYDIRETAEVRCKVQAYPKPEFQWQFGNNPSPLSMSSEGHYEINTTTDNNDIYTSVLRINRLGHQDYGEYLCRVANSLETIRAPIRLQPKGSPDKPRNLKADDSSSNSVTLNWDPGFDGGLANTKFFVSYRRVAAPHDDQVMPDCETNVITNTDWMEFDCHQSIPCQITALDQHQSYVFKVKALNTKGSSDYSNEVIKTTKVDHIPAPLSARFDPTTRTLGLSVGATCLSLIGIVESVINDGTPMAAWQIVETIQLQVSGHNPTHKETVIEHLVTARRSSARSLGVTDDDFPPLNDDATPRVRVKLCLRANHERCGDYADAESKSIDVKCFSFEFEFFKFFLFVFAVGHSYIAEASAIATPTLIAIIVSCIVFALFVGLLLMFCRCKRRQTKKSSQAKDYEMDSVRPSIVAQPSQAPPPYYPNSGLENKALEHSMELQLAIDDQKANVYATQNGYLYHHSVNNQQIPNTECK